MAYIQTNPECLTDEYLMTLGKELRLTALTNKFIELSQEQDFIKNEISYRELVATLLEEVQNSRSGRSLNRKLKELNFCYPHASLSGLEFAQRDGLTKAQAKELCACSWIEHGRNLIVTGGVGIGKTYVCDCLAICALVLGFKVYRAGCRSLLRKLPQLTAAEFELLKKHVSSCDLIYFDGFGQGVWTADNIDLFSSLIDEVTQSNRSVLINSQLPPSQWGSYIGDPLISDSMTDRMCPHNAIRIKLTGQSLRGANGTNGTQRPEEEKEQNAQMPIGKPFCDGTKKYHKRYHGTSTKNGTHDGTTKSTISEAGDIMSDDSFTEE